MEHSLALKFLVNLSAGLYKMRKVCFAVEASARVDDTFLFAVVIAVLAVDGTTLMRQVFFWAMRRMQIYQESNEMVRQVSRWYEAGGRGAKRTVLQTILPLSFVV